jgi:ABC-type branched-subunit amino acid transport system substrate-binding protein
MFSRAGILGNKILKDGATKVAILYANDAYGTGLESNVKSPSHRRWRNHRRW